MNLSRACLQGELRHNLGLEFPLLDRVCLERGGFGCASLYLSGRVANGHVDIFRKEPSHAFHGGDHVPGPGSVEPGLCSWNHRQDAKKAEARRKRVENKEQEDAKAIKRQGV